MILFNSTNRNLFTWPLWTHQQLHDVFGSSFSETQAVAERGLYIVAGWVGERGDTIPWMLQLSSTLVGRILARTYTMDGRTVEEAAPNVNASVPPEGALLGAWQGPLHHPCISRNIFKADKI